MLSMLPVAAHMKVLLDAPECELQPVLWTVLMPALYSFLAHHAFLKAAFLWLVARVVKESLASMDEERNRVSFMLSITLQAHGRHTYLCCRSSGRFWSHFGARLSPTHRPHFGHANPWTRRWVFLVALTRSSDLQTLSETLIAIVLLDNLSIPDALSLFLNQRTKALREILNPAEGSRQPRLRRDSRASIRTMSKEREEISSVLGDAVKSLLDTVTLVRAVFEKDKRQDGGSLLEEMERLVQIGEPISTSTKPGQDLKQRRTSHERRASRLASISISVPLIPNSATGPPISSGQILQSLPSAQILLKHLPTSITGFTPFIAPSSATGLEDKLAGWQRTAIGLLREAVPEWLGALHSVSDVWKLRHELDLLLKEGDLETDIKKALEEEWGRRIELVWENKLATLVELVEAKTKQAASEVQSGGSDTSEQFRALQFTIDNRYQPGIIHLFRDAVPLRTNSCTHSVTRFVHLVPFKRAETGRSANTSARSGVGRAGVVRNRNPGGYA